MSKLKIVCKVTIGDEEKYLHEIDPDYFRELMEKKIDRTMADLGFVRRKEKTA